LHLNVFDLETSLVALINVSLHGPPDDRRSRAVGTALAVANTDSWAGGIEIRGFDEVSIEPEGILLETISLTFSRDGRSLHVAVRRPDDGLEADFVATPASRPFSFDLRAPFGSGWISWFALPLVKISGKLRFDGRTILLNDAIGYHDHNWGRWFWGNDAAWEWGAFTFPNDGGVIVFARTCDKGHDVYGHVHFSVQMAGRTLVFPPHRVDIAFEGRLGGSNRRVPGALAAIHPDRRHPALPRTLRVTSSDGINGLQLTFEARSAAQLILAEPTRPGYGFINELTGGCRVRGRIGGIQVDATGLGVFEHVE
jgi:hypothetical protein